MQFIYSISYCCLQMFFFDSISSNSFYQMFFMYMQLLNGFR